MNSGLLASSSVRQVSVAVGISGVIHCMCGRGRRRHQQITELASDNRGDPRRQPWSAPRHSASGQRSSAASQGIQKRGKATVSTASSASRSPQIGGLDVMRSPLARPVGHHRYRLDEPKVFTTSTGGGVPARPIFRGNPAGSTRFPVNADGQRRHEAGPQSSS